MGVRVVAANLLMVNQRPQELWAELTSTADVDVLLLTEYSSRHHACATALGLRRSHPYGWEHIEEHSFGVAVYSRLPLVDSEEWQLAADIPCPRLVVQVSLVRFKGREESVCVCVCVCVCECV